MEVIFCIKLLLHLKTFKINSSFLVCAIPCLCIVKNGKNGHVHESGKVGKSDANFFYVDSYDLKSISLKFCNDILIGLEMPR